MKTRRHPRVISRRIDDERAILLCAHLANIGGHRFPERRAKFTFAKAAQSRVESPQEMTAHDAEKKRRDDEVGESSLREAHPV